MRSDSSLDGRGPGRRPLRLLFGLFLVTLALRPQLVGIAPLLPRIEIDLGISHGVAGLLSTIPVLCMGLFAPLGPWVASHLGPRRALAACVVAIIGFGLARAAVPQTGAVLLATIGVGFAMGTAGALMSIVVKERASRHPGLATGAYAGGMVTGAVIAAAVAVPLAMATGGWRPVLAIFSAATLVPLLGWLVLLAPDRSPRGHRVGPPGLPWRRPIAWGLALVFGLQSLLYYGVITWLPDIYRERGWSEASAGSLIALFNLCNLAAVIAIPFVVDRVGSRRLQLTSLAAAIVVALVGLIIAPHAGALWAGCLGFGLGALFPLALTLPVDVATEPADVGAAAAFMLLGGYLIAGTGPVVLGVVRDATGDFATSLWLLTGIATLFAFACTLLTPARLRRGIRRACA